MFTLIRDLFNIPDPDQKRLKVFAKTLNTLFSHGNIKLTDNKIITFPEREKIFKERLAK